MRQVIQDDKIGEIIYEESFWAGKKTVYINGQPLNKLSKNTFETADGTKAELKGNFLTGATLTVGEKPSTHCQSCQMVRNSNVRFALYTDYDLGQFHGAMQNSACNRRSHRRRNFRITQRDERRNYQKSRQAVA